MNELTSSLEDYLEAVYAVRGEDGGARVTDIAQALNVSKASVNKALGQLGAGGYIVHEHYGAAQLTGKGLEYAKEIISRHQFLISFLADVLGVLPDIADAEACLIEHSISRDTAKRWIEFTRKWKEENK